VIFTTAAESGLIPDWLSALCTVSNIKVGESPNSSPAKRNASEIVERKYVELKSDDGSWPFFGDRKRIYEREWYQQQYLELMKLMSVQNPKGLPAVCVVDGFAGIGKSMFLVWVMCKIFKSIKPTEDPSIIYILRKEMYFLKKNQSPRQLTKIEKCDYLFTDNVDVPNGGDLKSILQLGVSSDTDAFEELRKRKSELGGSTVQMPSFSLSEVVEFANINDLGLKEGL
jgi:hypothetical protein